MIMCKWQILAEGQLIGETDGFPYIDANRDDITHQRWSLMSKARELHPTAAFPGYEYRLVKADQEGSAFSATDLDVFINQPGIQE